MGREKLFLGIDGGGTHTRALCTTEDGTLVGRSQGGSTNYYTVGWDQARQNFKDILVELGSSTVEFASVHIGMPALERKATEEETAAFTQGLLKAEHVEMHTDAYPALVGHTLGEPGVLLISGTGSIAVASTTREELLVRGGWGPLLGDGGSAYSIALQALRALVRLADQDKDVDALWEAAAAFFSINTLRDLIPAVYEPPIDRAKLASFAVDVDRLADGGDPLCLRVMQEEALSLWEIAAPLIDAVGAPLSIGMQGSVLLNSSTMVSLLQQLVDERSPGCKVEPAMYSPEIGALVASFQAVGRALDREALDALASKTSGHEERRISCQ